MIENVMFENSRKDIMEKVTDYCKSVRGAEAEIEKQIGKAMQAMGVRECDMAELWKSMAELQAQLRMLPYICEKMETEIGRMCR